MRRFDRFAAIDWSGAKGSGHPGIAIALCEAGSAAPALVPPPGRYWSRSDVADWLEAQNGALLAGLDFSFAPPWIERRSYLPGEDVPDRATAFWSHVEASCDDADLGAASFLEARYRRHFYFGAADGEKRGFMHLRQCEARFNAGGGGKPSTVYDAIGAAQVAKASFAGMRLLNRVSQRLSVWPFHPVPPDGPMLVEIYTSIAARAAGLPRGRSKIRDAETLDAALGVLGSRPHCRLERYSDHATDAILTAAWLRANAHRLEYWNPAALDPAIAATEGWTFGVV